MQPFYATPIPTYQASHDDDVVAGNKKMKGAKSIDASGDKKQEHSIFTFKNTVKKIGSLLKKKK